MYGQIARGKIKTTKTGARTNVLVASLVEATEGEALIDLERPTQAMRSPDSARAALIESRSKREAGR